MFSALCCQESHDQQRIKYLCIDYNCSVPEKLGCADCFLEFHPLHRKISTSEFLQNAQKKLLDLKKIQAESNDFKVSQLLNQIDDQFDLCSKWILAKFNSLKVDLKSLIDADIENLEQDNQTMFSNLKKQVKQFEKIPNTSIHDLSKDDLEQLINFNKKSDSLMNTYDSQIQQINETKQKMKQKKQKYLRKMNTVVNTLLKEFKFNMTPEKSYEYILQSSPAVQKLVFTPVKNEKTQKMQADVTTQLLEMSRSKKKFTQKLDLQSQQSTQKKQKTK